MKISIVSGSKREGRTSHRVALALQKSLTEKGIHVNLIDLKQLQLKSFEERLINLNPKPKELLEVSELLKTSQAIVFVTPEYSGTIPSGLKNFIDVFGRAEFAGKPIGVATATTGIMGGIRAAQQLQQIILNIQAYPQPQLLLSAEVTKILTEEGQVINEAYQTKLTTFVDALVTFTERF